MPLEMLYVVHTSTSLPGKSATLLVIIAEVHHATRAMHHTPDILSAGRVT